MRLGRNVVLCLIALLASRAGLYAHTEPGQDDPPESVWLRLGPLALAPTVTLANLGWDSNVFQRPVDADPVGDFTLNIRPELQGWLRAGRARFSFRGGLDYAYFKEYATERSTDQAYDGRIEVPFNRVSPYFSVNWADGRQRFGFEIDERTRRRLESYLGGVTVRMGTKTSIDVAARKSRLDFRQDRLLSDPLVSDFYDYTSTGVAMTVRRELTPLTSFAVVVDGHQDEFDVAPERDSTSVGVSSGFEFKPFALLSGRAFLGWNRVDLEFDRASYSGLVTSVDLTYTLLGATKFAVAAERGLQYSAMRGQHAFHLTGVRGSVAHRLSEDWEIGARIGRYRQTYGLFDLVGADEDDFLGQNHETIMEYGADLGYRIGPDTRLGVDAVTSKRNSTVANDRGYKATRVGMSLSYRF